jgi:hypothetical protein
MQTGRFAGAPHLAISPTSLMFEGIDQIVEGFAIGLVQTHIRSSALRALYYLFRLITVAGHPDNRAWRRCVDDIEAAL